MSPRSPDDALEGLRARLVDQGQAHVVEQARGLGAEAGERLLAEAAAEDWDALRRAARGLGLGTPPELRPPVTLTLRRQQAVGGLRPRLAELGRDWLRQGRVATLLLAGGQGTRLGHPGPKGTFVLGPEPDRTLFAVLAERVGRASREAGHPIPLLVLVSEEGEDASRAAFAEPARLGLVPGQVRFVRQGSLPALDADGRALLSGPQRLLRAPDGHGGALLALSRAGLLDALAAEGVRVLTTFQVDNPLARPLDPVLLGWMRERRLEVVGKVVRRESPEERVGVFARDLDGRLRVVEYTELGRVASGNDLTLGNIAVHGLDLAWLRRLPLEREGVLPLHPSSKPASAWSPEAGRVVPVTATKLERYLFDVFPHAARAEVQEVVRAREFAPIKNAEGVDSPASARALVDAEIRRWHKERGLPEPSVPSLRPLDLDA